MLWGWLLDSFPQYHLHMIALGLVSTSLPTLGPLLGVPLSWMANNSQDRSFRNKQSHHMLWGWLLDSFPQYHLHMIALGLVSTSLPTLGPLLGVPLSWMAINPQERSFCNRQSHHMVWGRVVDFLLPYQLHMTPLVAEMHKSGDSSKDHGWSFFLRPWQSISCLQDLHLDPSGARIKFGAHPQCFGLLYKLQQPLLGVPAYLIWCASSPRNWFSTDSESWHRDSNSID